jgi:hypothetical protein
MSAVSSDIVLEDVIIKDTAITSDYLSFTQSTVEINNLNVSNITTEIQVYIVNSLTSNLTFNDISYSNSNAGMLLTVFSDDEFDSLTVSNITGTEYIISMLSSSLIQFSNIHISDVSVTGRGSIFIDHVVVTSISNVTIMNSQSKPINFVESTVSSIDQLNISNCTRGLTATDSTIDLIHNSTFDQ